MPVLRELQQEITETIGTSELDVTTWSRSSSNIVLLMRAEKQAYFAKIFAESHPGRVTADRRYSREKQILSQPLRVGKPNLVYSSDGARVLVTEAIPGFGFLYFIDRGEVLRGLRMMSKWVAGFHNSVPPQPVEEETLWSHLKQYAEFLDKPGFAALEQELDAIPVTELVLTKGDTSAANFRFNRQGVFGLDFEGCGMRAKEYDMIGLIEGLHELTGESVEDMAQAVIDGYTEVRVVADSETVMKSIVKIVAVLDRLG